MNAVDVISRILESNVLLGELIDIPNCGATKREIEMEETTTGQSFSDNLKFFLKQWNGANLEVVTIFGCVRESDDIPRFRDRKCFQSSLSEEVVIFGADPAGFLYGESKNGEIVSIDTDGGRILTVGSDFDDFISRFVFGKDSDLFGGDDWKEQLRVAGLVE